MKKIIWIRRGEIWIGTLGLFWSRDIKGIELPNGKGIWL